MLLYQIRLTQVHQSHLQFLEDEFATCMSVHLLLTIQWGRQDQKLDVRLWEPPNSCQYLKQHVPANTALIKSLQYQSYRKEIKSCCHELKCLPIFSHGVATGKVRAATKVIAIPPLETMNISTDVTTVNTFESWSNSWHNWLAYKLTNNMVVKKNKKSILRY